MLLSNPASYVLLLFFRLDTTSISLLTSSTKDMAADLINLVVEEEVVKGTLVSPSSLLLLLLLLLLLKVYLVEFNMRQKQVLSLVIIW